MNRIIFFPFLLFLSGCASARMADFASDQAFFEGRFEDAVQTLSQGLAEQGEEGRDELLYLLDLGLVLHTQGNFEESNHYFLKADQVAEIKDYTSLSTEAGTLLTTDQIRQYPGEDFEKILINTYLAMNYALLGDFENALVEVRRVHHKLNRMINEGQRNYQQNAFARYLSAIFYEIQGNPNEAYIDYRFVQKLEPSFPGLGLDLWRTAWRAGLREKLAEIDREFHLNSEDHRIAKRLASGQGQGEIVVLYENGISPIKRPHPNFYQIPIFYPRFNPVSQGRILLNGLEVGRTARLHSIEMAAIENLDEKYAGLIARKLAGIVVKETLGEQIAKKTDDPLMGLIAKLVMYVSDQADLRSWNLLPRDLQLARFAVSPGRYEVALLPEGASGSHVPWANLRTQWVDVHAGKKVFVNFRYVP